MIKNFYKNKKVLITGHTGFKGSWLTIFLHHLGCEIMGIALAPKTKDDLFTVAQLENYCKSYLHDINDLEFVKKKVSEFQPDIIFHLAAQPLVRYSYQNPIETYQTNVMGTANLLESVKGIEKKCSVVIITTDKVYENLEWHYPYRESDRLGGKDPYSASKACAELVVKSYRHSFFNIKDFNTHLKSIATVRAGNVIGGGDWSEDRLIPDLMRALRNNDEVIIRNPEAIRPWQHVIEPLYGYIELGAQLYQQPDAYTGEWNFGPYPEDVLNVEEVVKTAIQILKKGSYKVVKNPEDVHEATLLKLDISKALNKLHWKPLLSPQKSIETTIKWYEYYLSNKQNDMYTYTLNEIKQYLNLVE